MEKWTKKNTSSGNIKKNSYDESVFLDNITENRDILQELKYIFENESKKYIPLGLYGDMQLSLCMETDTGKIVAVDYENDSIEIIADSLEKMLDEMNF